MNRAGYLYGTVAAKAALLDYFYMLECDQWGSGQEEGEGGGGREGGEGGVAEKEPWGLLSQNASTCLPDGGPCLNETV